MASVMIAPGQNPEVFYRTGGANFRDTPPEQRLYWQSHIANSHRRILDAAELTNGKAVATVLGAGVAAEIPLAELARRYDRLILVDMDGPSMLEGLEQVPLGLRSKVELRVMDVTSFATALMEQVSDALNTGFGPDETFRRLDAVFDGLTAGEPVKLPPSDLVVSSLLLSEIPRYPFAYSDRLVRARFEASGRTWEGSNKAFRKLLMLAVEDHVRLLASLVRPGGVVYYSDTMARGPVYSQVTPAIRIAAGAAVLADYRRLGLASSAEEIPAAFGRLCSAEHPVKIEVEAYERLLAAFSKAGDSTFEPLLPLAEIQSQFQQRGLSLAGAAQSWFWLSYPCTIAQGPGAFLVNSWILRRTPAP
jgi:hypothetical protein